MSRFIKHFDFVTGIHETGAGGIAEEVMWIFIGTVRSKQRSMGSSFVILNIFYGKYLLCCVIWKTEYTE